MLDQMSKEELQTIRDMTDSKGGELVCESWSALIGIQFEELLDRDSNGARGLIRQCRASMDIGNQVRSLLADMAEEEKKNETELDSHDAGR